MRNGLINVTGQGFKGEKALAVASLLVGIAASVMIINLTILQRRHTKMQMEDLNKKNGNSNK